MNKFFKAILQNNIQQVTVHLNDNPFLVNEVIQKDEFLKSIPHWLYKGDTPLHLCAAALNLDITRLLLTHSADVTAANRRKATPLHYACDPRPKSGGVWNPLHQGKIIDLLINNGAEVNAMDISGVTPLHRAVRARSPIAVRHLLNAGSNVNSKTKIKLSTPLHLVIQSTGAEGTAGTSREQIEIIKILLDYDADLQAKDSRGRTPMDWANNKKILLLLKP